MATSKPAGCGRPEGPLHRQLFTELAPIRGGRLEAAEVAQRLAASNPDRCLIIHVQPPRVVARLYGPATYVAVRGAVHRTPSSGGDAGFCPGCGRFRSGGAYTLTEVPLPPHIARIPGSDRYRTWNIVGPWCPECGPEDRDRFSDYQTARSAAAELGRAARLAAGNAGLDVAAGGG